MAVGAGDGGDVGAQGQVLRQSQPPQVDVSVRGVARLGPRVPAKADRLKALVTLGTLIA